MTLAIGSYYTFLVSKPGIVVYAFSSGTQEVEEDRALRLRLALSTK